MQEISFSKIGEQYISNPIFLKGNGVVKYQAGYEKEGARFLIEKSFSPTSGWKLVSDVVVPKFPDYHIGCQYVPSGMYIRFRTDNEPKVVLVDVSSGGNDGTQEEIPPVVQEQLDNKLEQKVVDELPSIETAKENQIYIVRNEDGTDGNTHDEYVAVNGKWERIGGIMPSVDDSDIDALFK